MSSDEIVRPETRRRPGRPRRQVDLDSVADAVAQLFADVGYDGVSIEAVARVLGVSRATLYRTVPTKEELLSILFERSTADLLASAQRVVAMGEAPRLTLEGLIRVQTMAAVDMRGYVSVFYGGLGVSSEAYRRWRRWSHKYEAIWIDAVVAAMDSGDLETGDPTVTSHLLLGMLNWVTHWYDPAGQISMEQITNSAIGLVLPRR